MRRIDSAESRQALIRVRGMSSTVSAAAGSSRGAGAGKLASMTEPDPTLATIAAIFADLKVAKSRGGYTLVDPRTGAALARLKPFPQSDRFELFYWSNMKERWRTFGDFGRLRLTLERAHEILRKETIFHIQGTR